VAIYSLRVSCFSRSKGQSATAAAAYRSGQRIRDERTGELHDYSRKGGVVHREIVIPEGAPMWARDRERLWNAAEAAEQRKNSCVAREFMLALPSELKSDDRQRLAMDFARALATKHRCAVDVSLHRPGRGGDTRNHHAHLLCTTRRLHAVGFQEKTRELDDAKTGEVVFWRREWATLANTRFKERGLDIRIDHRTLQAQGIDRVPTVHKGPLLTALERRGIRSRVSERLDRERDEDVQARLTLAAERDRTVTATTEGKEHPSRSAFNQWRDEVRRQREEAKGKSQERERTPARTKDKDRDGPDYQR
jgi:ATP-dependent exoDNAse (exonuclease V) alpha subunit